MKKTIITGLSISTSFLLIATQSLVCVLIGLGIIYSVAFNEARKKKGSIAYGFVRALREVTKDIKASLKGVSINLLQQLISRLERR